jgi:hypothetical protein
LRLAALEVVIRKTGPRPNQRFPETARSTGTDRPNVVLGIGVSEPASKLVGQEDRTQRNVESPPQKKRGRPIEIPDERKLRALNVSGNRERARILYNTRYPTPQQVKNVSAILRHFGRSRQQPE